MIKTLDKKARLDLLRQASPEVQEMYGSEENGLVISATADKLGIVEELAYDTFALTVGDIILGTHPKESLGQMLKDRMGLTDEQIKMALDNLSDFLSKVPQQKKDVAPIVIDTPIEDVEKKTPVAEAEYVTPKTDHNVKAIRTFAGDVTSSRVHGYGTFQSGEVSDDKEDETPVHRSSQDDIIKRP